jgi:ubiquinone/menaquinone biosynthesis C-methylase UbiE
VERRDTAFVSQPARRVWRTRLHEGTSVYAGVRATKPLRGPRSAALQSHNTVIDATKSEWAQKRQLDIVPLVNFRSKNMDRHYFDEIASQWDRMRESAFNEAVRDHAISVANVQSGSEGLAADIGVGTGFIAQGLIDRGLRVIAIDHSINMLRVLKTKMPNAPALAFCQGDAERLPLCGDAVDYVFANMCLHHLTHPWHAVGEMARVLRVGGRLVITDLEAHHFAFLTQERRDRWLGFEHAELKRWLRDAGLMDVKVHDTGERVSVRSSSSDAHAQIGIVVASGDKLDRAGLDSGPSDGPRA